MDRGGTEELFNKAVSRRDALEVLSEGPLYRRDLQERLDISKTTCHRIVHEFDEHGLIERTDDGYRLSPFGEEVAGEVDRAARNVTTARELEPLLSAFEATDLRFDVSLFADATVTQAQPDNPYPPINRFVELLREAETLRSLDRTSIAPPYVDEIFELILEGGLKIEAIYPRSVVEKLFSEYPDYHRRAAELGRGTLRVHDDISFGMSLFDDRVGLRAYDQRTGALELFTDTGNEEAVEWAEGVFETYRERSRDPDWVSDGMIAPELRL